MKKLLLVAFLFTSHHALMPMEIVKQAWAKISPLLPWDIETVRSQAVQDTLDQIQKWIEQCHQKEPSLYPRYPETVEGDSSSKEDEPPQRSFCYITIKILFSIRDQIEDQKQNKLEKSKRIIRPADGGLIARNVQPLVETILENNELSEFDAYRIWEIAGFIQFCHDKQIPFLVNAGAKYEIKATSITGDLSDWNFMWDFLMDSICRNFPEEIHVYLKKHFVLKCAGQDEELSIADYIALNGQPPLYLDSLTRRPSIDLNKKQITSLHGIDQLKQAENVHDLYLENNAILDHTADPDFPGTPFARYKNLRQLYFEGNQLQSLPESIFQGLKQLEYLFLSNNRLDTIAEGTIGKTPNLQRLELMKNNNLKTLPLTIYKKMLQEDGRRFSVDIGRFNERLATDTELQELLRKK